MNIGRGTGSAPSRRDFLRLSGAAGTVLGLGACGFGRTDGGRTALKVWDQFTTSPQNEAVQKIYDIYRRSAHVTIDRSTQPGDQMTTVGKTALASGTGPDVIYYEVGKGNAGVLADAGLIRPLDDLAAKHGWLDRLTPFAVRESRLNGKLYGLPNETETTVLFYNKTLIDKSGLTVPQTFDELLGFCAKAKAKKLVPIAYGQADVYPCWWAFSLMTNNIAGGSAMGDLIFDGKGGWNTPQMKEAIQLFFVDLVKAGAFIDDLNALHGPDAQSTFLAGKALMNLNGTWAVGAVEKGLEGQEVGIMPMPSIDGGARVYPAGTGSAYYISAKSKRAEEAGAFLDSLYKPEALRIWVEQGKIIPPVPLDPSNWSLSPLQKQALAAARNGRDLGYSVNHGKASPGFLNAMTSGFQAVVQGRKSAAQQADDLQKAWEKGL